MYQGEKVVLRAYDNSDLMRELSFVNDYETMKGVTSGLILPSTVDDEAAYIGAQTARSRGEYQFAVETLEEGVFIGRCGFISLESRSRVAEMGILIGDKAYRGKGYGTDAVRTLCRFGFSELNLHKIKASVFDFNMSAQRCYEKCGFVREGMLKSEVFRDGAYRDVILMATLGGG